MTLDAVYPRLLDAWVTEHASALTSRHEVRQAIEQALDQSAPHEQRAKTHGMQMDRQRWEQLKAAAEERKQRRRQGR